jgi:arylamine N-acetyltransferase
VVPPRTHTLRLVDLAGQAWIADAGFGGSSVPPLPLRDGACAQTADGARHRLRRVGAWTGEWLVERAGTRAATDGRADPHEDWQAQYSFDTGEVAPVDLEMSNSWTCTRPGTRFTSGCVASIVLPDGFAALSGRRLSTYAGGRADVIEIASAADWRTVLADVFRIELSAQEASDLF